MSENRWRRGCLTDGQLRQIIDEPGENPSQDHIGACIRCQRRLNALRATADAARAGLLATDVTADVQPEASYQRLRARMNQRARDENRSAMGGSFMSELFARRAVRASSVVAAAVAMMLVLAVSPMRTVADDFFNQFRVQKFAAVTIPMDLIEPLNSGLLQTMTEADKERVKDEFEQLGAFDTTFSFDSLPEAGTVDEARIEFGDFAVPDDLPDGFDSEPNAYVTEAGTASYALNVERAREIIDSFNLPIYALDDIQAETIQFEANIPAAVLLEYQNANGERVFVGQMASPRLSFPDELDMNELREEILRFPGLPTDLVAQLRAIDDWENTLIIPIPEGAESDDVTVNGEAGLLIEHALGSAVLWEDGGVLYAVVGQVSGDTVRDVADSMD